MLSVFRGLVWAAPEVATPQLGEAEVQQDVTLGKDFGLSLLGSQSLGKGTDGMDRWVGWVCGWVETPVGYLGLMCTYRLHRSSFFWFIRFMFSDPIR